MAGGAATENEAGGAAAVALPRYQRPPWIQTQLDQGYRPYSFFVHHKGRTTPLFNPPRGGATSTTPARAERDPEGEVASTSPPPAAVTSPAPTPQHSPTHTIAATVTSDQDSGQLTSTAQSSDSERPGDMDKDDDRFILYRTGDLKPINSSDEDNFSVSDRNSSDVNGVYGNTQPGHLVTKLYTTGQEVDNPEEDTVMEQDNPEEDTVMEQDNPVKVTDIDSHSMKDIVGHERPPATQPTNVSTAAVIPNSTTPTPTPTTIASTHMWLQTSMTLTSAKGQGYTTPTSPTSTPSPSPPSSSPTTIRLVTRKATVPAQVSVSPNTTTVSTISSTVPPDTHSTAAASTQRVIQTTEGVSPTTARVNHTTTGSDHITTTPPPSPSTTSQPAEDTTQPQPEVTQQISMEKHIPTTAVEENVTTSTTVAMTTQTEQTSASSSDTNYTTPGSSVNITKVKVKSSKATVTISTTPGGSTKRSKTRRRQRPRRPRTTTPAWSLSMGHGSFSTPEGVLQSLASPTYRPVAYHTLPVITPTPEHSYLKNTTLGLHGLSSGEVTGVAVGCIVAFWIILGPLVCIICRMRDRAKEKRREREQEDSMSHTLIEEMIRLELARGRAKMYRTNVDDEREIERLPLQHGDGTHNSHGNGCVINPQDYVIGNKYKEYTRLSGSPMVIRDTAKDYGKFNGSVVAPKEYDKEYTKLHNESPATLQKHDKGYILTNNSYWDTLESKPLKRDTCV